MEYQNFDFLDRKFKNATKTITMYGELEEQKTKGRTVADDDSEGAKKIKKT